MGALVLAVAPILMTGAGCGTNKAATEACKDSKDGDKCGECCIKNGAKNFGFVSGGGCVCRDN